MNNLNDDVLAQSVMDAKENDEKDAESDELMVIATKQRRNGQNHVALLEPKPPLCSNRRPAVPSTNSPLKILENKDRLDSFLPSQQLIELVEIQSNI
jgi:hypothetical protein